MRFLLLAIHRRTGPKIKQVIFLIFNELLLIASLLETDLREELVLEPRKLSGRQCYILRLIMFDPQSRFDVLDDGVRDFWTGARTLDSFRLIFICNKFCRTIGVLTASIHVKLWQHNTTPFHAGPRAHDLLPKLQNRVILLNIMGIPLRIKYLKLLRGLI